MSELNLDNVTAGLAIELAPRRPTERSEADPGPSFQEHWQRTQAAAPENPSVEKRKGAERPADERTVADQGASEQAPSCQKPKSEPSSDDAPQLDHARGTESDKIQQEPTEESRSDTDVPAANMGAVAAVAQLLTIEDIEIAPVGESQSPPTTETVPAGGNPAATNPTVPAPSVASALAAIDALASATSPVDEQSIGTPDGESQPIEAHAAGEVGSTRIGAAQPTAKIAAQSEAAGPNYVQQAVPDRTASNVVPVVDDATTGQEGRRPQTGSKQEERTQATSPIAKAALPGDPNAQISPNPPAIDSVAATSSAVDGTTRPLLDQGIPTDGPNARAADSSDATRLVTPPSDQPSSPTESPAVGALSNVASVKGERGAIWNSSVQGGSDAETSRGLTDVERARLVQRVAGAFQTASERGAPIRLRLSPPELGALRLEVAVRDGMMHARLEAESRQTQTLLIDNLPALRERLAAQDIRLGAFDVGLMDSTAGGLPQRPQDQGVPNQTGRLGGLREEANDALPAASIEPVSLVSSDRLNVVI